MEEVIHNFRIATESGTATEEQINDIAGNIEEAVKFPEFFEVGLKMIREVIDRAEDIDVKSIETIIRSCINNYGDEGMTILKNIKVEEKTEEEIIEILATLEDIPIIKASERIIEGLLMELEEERWGDDDDGIKVDWEIKFEEMKKAKEELENEILDLKVKFMAPQVTADELMEILWDENKALIIACEKGYLKIVRYLIEKGVDIETKNDKGDNPLITVSENGHLDVVKYLLENCADIEAKDTNGNAALIIACFRGHLEVVKCLIEHGADIEVKNINGNTPLIMASFGGHLEVVKCLIEHGADIEVKNDNGDTPLIMASFGGHLEVVKYLIEQGADVEAENNDGNSSLVIAIYKRYLEIAKSLMDKGARVEAKNNV